MNKTQLLAQLDVTEKQVYSRGGIKRGRSIFLMSTKRATQNIERGVPYARVEHVTRRFPDKVEVKLSLRSGLFFFQRDHDDGTDYLLLDRDLKVLERRNAPQLVNPFPAVNNIQLLDVPAAGLQPGRFLTSAILYNFIEELHVPRVSGGSPFTYDLKADIRSIGRSSNDLVLTTRSLAAVNSVITIENATRDIILLGNMFISYMMQTYPTYGERRNITFYYHDSVVPSEREWRILSVPYN
jgi:hypothetical protein